MSGRTADGKTKKKRGRKPKAAKGVGAGDDAEGTPSLVGGKAPTNVSGQGGGGDKEEEEEEYEEMAVENTEVRTKEQEQEEQRMRAMLYQALDNKQKNQYEVWRGSSVKEANVKRVSEPRHFVMSSEVYGADVLSVTRLSTPQFPSPSPPWSAQLFGLLPRSLLESS